MTNSEIREAIKKIRLFHYEVAEALGIGESALSKMLRKELSAEKKQRVMQAIEAVKNGGTNQ